MNLEERTKIFYDKVKRKFPHELYEIKNFIGTKHPVTIVCLQCGRERTLSRAEQVLDLKAICPCHLEKKVSEHNIELHREIEEWFQQNEGYTLLQNFTAIGTTIQIQCKKCGAIQNRNPEHFLKDSRCLSCEKKCVIRKSQDAFCEELQAKFDDEYTLIGEYNSANERVLIKHSPCGKIFSTRAHDLLTGHSGCPLCNKSKGEKKIADFLSKHGIDFISQYRLDEYRKAPYDFFLPQYNLLIEFQGRQHCEPVKAFGGQAQFEQQQLIDQKKQLLAHQKSLDLLYISYLQLSDIPSILAQRLSIKE